MQTCNIKPATCSPLCHPVPSAHHRTSEPAQPVLVRCSINPASRLPEQAPTGPLKHQPSSQQQPSSSPPCPCAPLELLHCLGSLAALFSAVGIPILPRSKRSLTAGENNYVRILKRPQTRTNCPLGILFVKGLIVSSWSRGVVPFLPSSFSFFPWVGTNSFSPSFTRDLGKLKSHPSTTFALQLPCPVSAWENS